MIRILFQLFLVMILPSILCAQSIKISATEATSANGMSVYTLDQGNKVELKSGSVRFLGKGAPAYDFSAVGFSPDRSLVGVVQNTGNEARILLLTPQGDTLNSFSSVSLRANDPSLAVYPTNTGHSLLRDNIMNFTFHDGTGVVGESISTGSGSKAGETVTKVATSPNQEVTVFYTPKIKQKGALGSKAELLLADHTIRRIFQDESRYIKSVELSDDGSQIAIVTAAEGTADRVVLLDQYGNRLNDLTAEEDLIGAGLSGDGRYVTLFSKGRVRIYDVLTSERLGSASIDSPVYEVAYFPEDKRLFIASGNYSEVSGVLQNVDIKIVLLDKRTIISEQYSGALRFHKAFEPTFERLSAAKYELQGGNKNLRIELY